MRHAFDESEPAPAWWQSLGAGDILLMVLCLPAILGAVWVGCLHYNTGQAIAALRWSVLPREPRPAPPVMLAGSAAGAVFWIGFSALGGSAYFLELLTASRVWLVILLPELVWMLSLGPVLLLALLLALLRRMTLALVGHSGGRGLGYDAADAVPARQHAFHEPRLAGRRRSHADPDSPAEPGEAGMQRDRGA